MSSDNTTGRTHRALLWCSFPAVAIVAVAAFTIGTSRMKSAAPVVDRSALQIETVRGGPLVRHVSGLGVLVPEETRWIAAETNAHVDEVFLRAGARVQPGSILLRMSSPDLERQVLDAELATKKLEAELANLRVQLQAQLLNEHATEAELQSDLTEAKLQAERDEALQKDGIGSKMTAKISKARADSFTTRWQLEKEKLAIAEEARQAQLAAKQAEVAQVQALFELKLHQKESLIVRAGIAGILDEISVDAGQQVGAGANLARVTSSERLVARIHVPESQAADVRLHQRAALQMQDRKFSGQVIRVDPAVQNGAITVDIKADGGQAAGAHSGVSVDGTIETGRLPNSVYLPQELQARTDATMPMFKVSDDGTEARRINVQFGRVSEDGTEIVGGVAPGERVIISDMSTWNRYDQVRLE